LKLNKVIFSKFNIEETLIEGAAENVGFATLEIMSGLKLRRQ
jgi:hypothetical protein